jgi:hypothetical protein
MILKQEYQDVHGLPEFSALTFRGFCKIPALLSHLDATPSTGFSTWLIRYLRSWLI